MASVGQNISGLPQNIYVSTKDSVHGAHGPRIKVSNIPGTFSRTDNFVVSIDKINPEIKSGKSIYKNSQNEDIFDWVLLNHKTLMKYWNSGYATDAEFRQDLKKL
jgi:hypothetical protein